MLNQSIKQIHIYPDSAAKLSRSRQFYESSVHAWNIFIMSAPLDWVLVYLLAPFLKSPMGINDVFFMLPLFLLAAGCLFLAKESVFAWIARLRSTRQHFSLARNRNNRWVFVGIMALLILGKVTLGMGLFSWKLLLVLLPVGVVMVQAINKTMKEKEKIDLQLENDREFFLEHTSRQNLLFAVMPPAIVRAAALISVFNFSAGGSALQLFYYLTSLLLLIQLEPGLNDFLQSCKRCASFRVRDNLSGDLCEDCKKAASVAAGRRC